MEAEPILEQGCTLIPHIDDALGPAAQRYFGEGYKKTQYRCNVKYTASFAEGTIAIDYRTDWSQKKKVSSRPPHLSTIDAFLVAGRIACELLRREFNLSEQQTSQAWIRHLSIKAGSEALEDLVAVPLSTRLIKSVTDNNSMFGVLSHFKTVLKTMEVEIIIDHPPGIDSHTVNAAPLNAEEYFIDEFRERHCELYNNSFNDKSCAVSCELTLQRPGKQFSGLMGHYPHALMIVDWLTSFAQLSQLVMYRLDNVQRNQTNNLWMRSVKITAPYPIIPQQKHTLTLRSTRNSLINKNHEQWRLATVSGSIASHPEFSLSAKLCHSLPQGTIA
ncbi:AvrD family protein [Agarivorans sp. QJM3NY_33]|uniref:AvrD family protein n=1 Tax=Agarivorans sp. QJM3NY_33 TaxID=3421432 RepID=UPI003D7D5CBB